MNESRRQSLAQTFEALFWTVCIAGGVLCVLLAVRIALSSRDWRAIYAVLVIGCATLMTVKYLLGVLLRKT